MSWNAPSPKMQTSTVHSCEKNRSSYQLYIYPYSGFGFSTQQTSVQVSTFRLFIHQCKRIEGHLTLYGFSLLRPYQSHCSLYTHHLAKDDIFENELVVSSHTVMTQDIRATNLVNLLWNIDVWCVIRFESPFSFQFGIKNALATWLTTKTPRYHAYLSITHV